MPSPLYNRDILRLAASIAHQGRLPHADASAQGYSAVCGSQVNVDVVVDKDGRLADLGLDIHACALGQASASLMSAHAIGKNAGDIETAAVRLKALLAKDEGEAALDFWPGMDILMVARMYPARHPSIMLPFETLGEAMKKATDAGKHQVVEGGQVGKAEE